MFGSITEQSEIEHYYKTLALSSKLKPNSKLLL